MSEASRIESQPEAGLDRPSLGGWSLYFLFKLLLHIQGSLQVKPLENLALIAFVAYPLRSAWLRGLRLLLAVPVAVWLIHAESWLPGWAQLLPSIQLMLGFDLDYLLELAGRAVSPELLALLVLLVFGYLILSHFIRMGVIVTGLMLYLAVGSFGPREDGPLAEQASREPGVAGEPRANGSGESLNDKLSAFYRQQAGLQARFSTPASQSAPFDILFLHICSLSWDDMHHAGAEGVLPAFDVLFKNFNTATSYSGPAAIRLLRAGCGQPSHERLYQPAEEACYLFDQLAGLGFDKQLVMNHDGHFDEFLQILQENHMDAQPMPLDEVPAGIRAFDGSPIHDDLPTLMAWWNRRQAGEATRVAAYYNTLTLHDGNRFVSGKRSGSSLEGYGRRLRRLMNDLRQFFLQLEQSGRRILVIMVPEHGAALKGSRFQLQGMREIPTPDITRVPVGIRLFGPELTRPASPVVVQQAVSYLALSEYVSNLLAQDPFLPQQYRPEHLVGALTETHLVAETSTAVVMEDEGRFWISLRESEDWMPLNPER